MSKNKRKQINKKYLRNKMIKNSKPQEKPQVEKVYHAEKRKKYEAAKQKRQANKRFNEMPLGTAEDKAVFTKWFNENKTRIHKIRDTKEFAFVWENFSRNDYELREQLYMDRAYIQSVRKISMKDSIKTLMHSNAFMAKGDLFAENMLNAMDTYEPSTYQHLTELLGCDPKNASRSYEQIETDQRLKYDKGRDRKYKYKGIIILQGPKGTYAVEAKYDNFSPKGETSESSFIIYEA